MGLQAYLTMKNGRPEVTFVLDDKLSLKGMVVSARLLKLLNLVGNRKLFIINRNLAIYVDKLMIIGVCDRKISKNFIGAVKKFLTTLHDYLARYNPEDVDAFINALINFIKTRKFNYVEGISS